MPRKPSFTYKKTPDGWKVEIPMSLSETGKRERAFFKTRDEARDYAQKLEKAYKKQGRNAVAIKPSLAEEAVRAASILEPTGAGLIEAAKAFRRQWDARNASVPFKEAVDLYLTSRQGLREATLSSYRYTLLTLFKPLHGKILADVAAKDLIGVLESRKSQRMHLANLRAMWRWAAKPPRSWCDPEVVEALEPPRTSNDSDIAILKPAEVKALLRAAEAESHAAAAAYAVALFGGVRMGELAKLTWSCVGEDSIEIGKAVAKRHARRLVPIDTTLRAWLDAHRHDAGPDDKIVPPNWSQVSKAVRRRAGWNLVAPLLKDPPKPTRGRWPSNACRHTCASVQVAIGTPLEVLTFGFGHSGGHDLLRRHYVSRLSKKDALAILKIGPSGKKIRMVEVA